MQNGQGFTFRHKKAPTISVSAFDWSFGRRLEYSSVRKGLYYYSVYRQMYPATVSHFPKQQRLTAAIVTPNAEAASVAVL